MRWLQLFAVLLVSLVFARAQSVETVADRSSILGVPVRYEERLHSRTSQGDIVVRVVTEPTRDYVRLRYAPNGWAFDAPPAAPSQLLPKDIISDQVVWNFRIHRPRNKGEEGACSALEKVWLPDPSGQLIETQRYRSIPGREQEKMPDWRTLPCFIIDSWERRTDSPVGP